MAKSNEDDPLANLPKLDTEPGVDGFWWPLWGVVAFIALAVIVGLCVSANP